MSMERGKIASFSFRKGKNREGYTLWRMGSMFQATALRS